MIYEDRPVTRKLIKADARKLLSRPKLFLKLMFGGFMYIAVTILFELIWDYLFTTASFFFPNEKTFSIAECLSNIIRTLPSFFITSPLFMGIWHIAAALINGDDTDFLGIFGYYTPNKASRAYKTMAPIQLPLAFIAAASKIPSLFFEEDKIIGFSFDLAFLILFSVVAAIIVGRLLPFINSVVCGGDQPVSLCLKASLTSTKGKAWRMIWFILSFTPWILLSLVTVGTLFIIFTFPYMIVAVSLCSSYLLTGKYRTQISEDTL